MTQAGGPAQRRRPHEPVAGPHFGHDVPFMTLLGVVPELYTTDGVRTRLPYRPEICNSRGEVHGGTLMSVLDFTLSAAARAQEAGTGMATIGMNTSFMAPALTDVLFEARCLRKGATVAFCEGYARDTSGRLLASASATFKIIRHRARPA